MNIVHAMFAVKWGMYDRFQFPPVCELAHTSPQNISRRLSTLGRRRGIGRWPPETKPPFVKSANEGALINAGKKWHFGNGAIKDTSTAESPSWSVPATIAGPNRSIRGPTRSWTKLSNGNTTSSRNRGRLISARSPHLGGCRAPTPVFGSNYSGRAETCADLLERALGV